MISKRDNPRCEGRTKDENSDTMALTISTPSLVGFGSPIFVLGVRWWDASKKSLPLCLIREGGDFTLMHTLAELPLCRNVHKFRFNSILFKI